jgi:serine/threonine-protein kinase RsbW
MDAYPRLFYHRSMMAATATMYSGTFHGRPDQVQRVRAAVARYLDGCPAVDDAVLVVSEIAADAVLHSQSSDDFFAVRCELYPDYVWVECEDLGGPWHRSQPDGCLHGLDVVEALVGPDGWGTGETTDGDRVVWVRLAR